jgi:hypothetical protein
MACECLRMKDQDEFFTRLKNKDSELIIKMVKCILNAYKKKKSKVDIFDITFKDKSSLVFSINKGNYNELLSNCLKDLEKLEEYELCGEIMKTLNKKVRKPRKHHEQEKNLL